MVRLAKCEPLRAVFRDARFASQRMEGLEPERQVLEDAQKWARGEKTISQAIADFKAPNLLLLPIHSIALAEGIRL